MEAKNKMNNIENYNCEGMCVEETCNNRYTKHTSLKLNGMKVHILLCEKHAEQFENYED
jgi:hypothetical protein